MASGRLALPRGGGSAEQRKPVSDQTIADAVDQLSGAAVGTVALLAGAPPALEDLAAAAEQAAGGSTGKKRKAEEASPPGAAAPAGDAATAERQTTGGRSRRATAGKKPQLAAEFDSGADSWDDDSEEDSPPKGEAAWVPAGGGGGCHRGHASLRSMLRGCWVLPPRRALPPPPPPPINWWVLPSCCSFSHLQASGSARPRRTRTLRRSASRRAPARARRRAARTTLPRVGGWLLIVRAMGSQVLPVDGHVVSFRGWGLLAVMHLLPLAIVAFCCCWLHPAPTCTPRQQGHRLHPPCCPL